MEWTLIFLWQANKISITIPKLQQGSDLPKSSLQRSSPATPPTHSASRLGEMARWWRTHCSLHSLFFPACHLCGCSTCFLHFFSHSQYEGGRWGKLTSSSTSSITSSCRVAGWENARKGEVLLPGFSSLSLNLFKSLHLILKKYKLS